MPVILCGRTALWFWRSGVRTTPAITDRRECERIIGLATLSRDVVDAVLCGIGQVCGFIWSGVVEPEVLVVPRRHTGSVDVRVRHRKWTDEDKLYRIIGVPDAYVTGPATSLDMISHELGSLRTELLALEMAGTFRMSVQAGCPAKMRQKRLMTIDEAVRVARASHRTKPEIYACCADGCASPIEARILMLLCASSIRGGFGLPVPMVNSHVDMDEAGRQLSYKGGADPDYLWPDRGVILEYDSDEWHGGSKTADPVNQLRKDSTRNQALRNMGYKVHNLVSTTLFDYNAFKAFVSMFTIDLGMYRRPKKDLAEWRRFNFWQQVLYIDDPLDGRRLPSNPVRNR